MKDILQQILSNNQSPSSNGDLSDLELNLIALSCGSYAKWTKVMNWVETSQPDLADFWEEVLETGSIDDIFETMDTFKCRYEYHSKEIYDSTPFTPKLEELFAYIQLHGLDYDEIKALHEYTNLMIARIEKRKNQGMQE